VVDPLLGPVVEVVVWPAVVDVVDSVVLLVWPDAAVGPNRTMPRPPPTSSELVMAAARTVLRIETPSRSVVAPGG
jgi:hypothetical protein